MRKMSFAAFSDHKWAVESLGTANDCPSFAGTYLWGRGLQTWEYLWGWHFFAHHLSQVKRETCFYTLDSDTANFAL